MITFRTILVFFIFLSATAGQANAQRRYRLNPMNTVYGEFFIIAPDLSNFQPGICYERLFSPKGTFSGRIGIMPALKHKVLIIPLTIQGYTPGGKQHHIEYGGGIMPSVDYNKDTGKIEYIFYPAVMAGYRYQRSTGLVIRATANIIIHKSVYLNPSVSIGYQF